DLTEIRNLLVYIGPGPTLAVVTFIAFLCGALWIDVVPPVVGAVSSRAQLTIRGVRMRRHIRRNYDLDAAARTGNAGPEESSRSLLLQAFLSRIREAYDSGEEFRDAYLRRLATIPLVG